MFNDFHISHHLTFWDSSPRYYQWFALKGTFLTGKPHDLHGKIDGFRLRFSPTIPVTPSDCSNVATWTAGLNRKKGWI